MLSHQLTDVQTAHVRNFVAMMATYHDTMKFKHIRIALRCYCIAHAIDPTEAAREVNDIINNR